MAELFELTMLQQAAAIRTGELSPVELAEHYLRRIERYNGQVAAFVTVTADRALDDARRAERALARGGDLPALLGVPVPIKDLTPVAGVRFTSGSRVFTERIADYDSATVELLNKAGTVLLGKTNTPEFGLPAYTEGPVDSPARTPFDLARGAGGSSGGAAAAVAAGLAPVAHGSDGGGSIRIPASCCGVVGLKTTRGRVSAAPNGDVSGLVVQGPIARTVTDAAALLDVMAQAVPGDPAPLAPPEVTFVEQARREPGRLRIARFAEPGVANANVDPWVLDAYERTARLLAELGHEVVEIPQPLTPEERDAFDPVWSVLAAMTPVPPERESELMPLSRWLRERGRGITGLEYVQALSAMQAAGRKLVHSIASFDALLNPTLAQLPARIGALRDDHDPVADFAKQLAFTPFTSPWNIAGNPAISLPLAWMTEARSRPSVVLGAPDRTGDDIGGRDSDGVSPVLPIGMMLVGRYAGEGPLLSLAAQIEAACPWRSCWPALD